MDFNMNTQGLNQKNNTSKGKDGRKIRIKWIRRENDLMIYWDEGLKCHAGYIHDNCFPKEVQEELTKRGLNIKTLKFSIESL